MNHEQIDQLDIIDRYLMDKLSAEESVSFEKHFVACPQCTARLRTTKNFMQDLQLLATEQAAQIELRSPKKPFWQFVKTLIPKPLAWATVGLLIASAVGTVFVINHTQHLRDEANQARVLSEQWQRRYEEERQSAIAAESSHHLASAQQTEQLRAMEAKLKQEEELRAKITADAIGRLPGAGNLPIFILTSVRSSEPNSAQLIKRIPLPRSAAIFAFSIALEDETRYETYRIKIIDDRQRVIIEQMTPIREGAISIWLKPNLFQPGPYSLIIEGDNNEGRMKVIGNYSFLIDKTS